MDSSQKERIKYSIEGAIFGLSPYLISELCLSLNFISNTLPSKGTAHHGTYSASFAKKMEELDQMRKFIKPSAILCPTAAAIATYALYPKLAIDTEEAKSDGRVLERPSYLLNL